MEQLQNLELLLEGGFEAVLHMSSQDSLPCRHTQAFGYPTCSNQLGACTMRASSAPDS